MFLGCEKSLFQFLVQRLRHQLQPILGESQPGLNPIREASSNQSADLSDYLEIISAVARYPDLANRSPSCKLPGPGAGAGFADSQQFHELI